MASAVYAIIRKFLGDVNKFGRDGGGRGGGKRAGTAVARRVIIRAIFWNFLFDIKERAEKDSFLLFTRCLEVICVYSWGGNGEAGEKLFEGLYFGFGE